MLTRLSGRLVSMEGNAAVVEPAPGWGLEVLLPAYAAESLAARVGETVTLHTLVYLEGQGQGTSFVPRLLGFARPADREFFELFTTVKGVGNKKALRAMAMEPARIARAIAERDARALQSLPEIGKRLAETVIAELSGKVEAFLTEGEAAALDRAAGARVGAGSTLEPKRGLPPAALEAIETLIALGESESDAERLVRRALAKASEGVTSGDLVAVALGGRG